MEDRYLLGLWNRYVATDDMAALEELHNALYQNSLFFAKDKCQDYPHLKAEDIVDAVWERLVLKKPRIERNIRSYILVMIKHTIIDLLRKNNRVVSHEIPESTVSESITSVFLQEDEAKYRDLERKKCLSKKEYNFAIRLYELLSNHKRQQAHEQLTKIFGISLKTVNDRRRLITKKLKACRAKEQII